MNILICGGAGYIGARTARFVAEHGHRVTVFDDLSSGHRQALRWGDFVHGDVTNPADVDGAFRSSAFDAVVHFASISSVKESVENPAKYEHNIVGGSVNLIEAMQRYGVKRFVYSSSASVYGEPTNDRIAETHACRPMNPYGACKLAVEQRLALAAAEQGLASISLRYFNAAGADIEGGLGESHTPETHLIPNVLLAALRRRPALELYGGDYPTPDGTCVRDYVHIDDLAAAHLQALEATRVAATARAFNLGSGCGYSVMDVVRTIERITGQRVPYTLSPRRPGDPPALVADIAAARSELEWAPRVSDLDSIIESAWRWHRDPAY